MDRQEIFDYCNSRHISLCIERQFRYCPYREEYKDNLFCTISEFILDFYARNNYKNDLNFYIKKACPTISSELYEDKSFFNEIKNRSIHFLNSVKEGDLVYSLSDCDDVILLVKNVDLNGRCRCKTLEGREFIISPRFLRLISNGEKHVILKIKGIDKFLEHKARSQGFRVEKVLHPNLTIYKIYGDSQEDLDEFVQFLDKS